MGPIEQSELPPFKASFAAFWQFFLFCVILQLNREMMMLIIESIVAKCMALREGQARQLEMFEAGAMKTRVDGIDTSAEEAEECRLQIASLDAFLADLAEPSA